MARKETPDVLGELLAGAGEAPVLNMAAPPAPPQRTKRQPSRKQPAKAAQPEQSAVRGWDYLVISFSDYRGWRPRFINGREIRNWMQAPVIHDYLAQLGEDGWELTGAGGGKALYGSSDTYQAFFKRPKR